MPSVATHLKPTHRRPTDRRPTVLCWAHPARRMQRGPSVVLARCRVKHQPCSGQAVDISAVGRFHLTPPPSPVARQAGGTPTSAYRLDLDPGHRLVCSPAPPPSVRTPRATGRTTPHLRRRPSTGWWPACDFFCGDAAGCAGSPPTRSRRHVHHRRAPGAVHERVDQVLPARGQA